MTDWPPIEDQRTLRRFAMSDEEFQALAVRLAERIGGEPYAQDHLERAITYPWHSVELSAGFLLEGDQATPLESLTQERHARATTLTGERGEPVHALLAIGSNASPEVLAAKLAGLDDETDRTVLAVGGRLSGYAIGHSPHLAVYGAMPATIHRSPGAEIDATVLYVTARQLSALAATEFNYLLGRVDRLAFTGEVAHPEDTAVHCFVSRHGVATDERGAPVALAEDSQLAVLQRATRLALGDEAQPSDLVRRCVESYAWAVTTAKPALAEMSAPLDRSRWPVHPGGIND